MGNIKSRALLYLYFVNLFIKKQSTPHHRDKQRKSRKRAVSNRPKKPILRQPLLLHRSVGLAHIFFGPGHRNHIAFRNGVRRQLLADPGPIRHFVPAVYRLIII